MSGFPTVQCPACGAFERLGTQRCFSCAAPMNGSESSDRSSGPDGSRRPSSPDGSMGPAAAITPSAAGFGSGTQQSSDDDTIGEDDHAATWSSPGGSPMAAVPGPGFGSDRRSSDPSSIGPFQPGAGYVSAYDAGYGQGYGGYGTSYGLPGSAHPPGAYGYPAPQQEKGATTALVLGLASFVFCGFLLGPAAVFEGYKARRRIAESNGMLTGDGMALAGMILGVVGLVVNVAFVVLRIALMTSTSTYRF